MHVGDWGARAESHSNCIKLKESQQQWITVVFYLCCGFRQRLSQTLESEIYYVCNVNNVHFTFSKNGLMFDSRFHKGI